MVIQETALPGCFKLALAKQVDRRGHFIKWFNKDAFINAGLCSEWAEVYGSQSHRGVVRGLHFQRPPADHAKLVCCLAGRAIDVVLDLRRSSPSFGRHIKVGLSADEPTAVYIPTGCAHGFFAEVDNTFMQYQVSSSHSSSLDDGIRWDSAGILWPTDEPIISLRDQTFQKLDEFVSPFN